MFEQKHIWLTEDELASMLNLLCGLWTEVHPWEAL